MPPRHRLPSPKRTEAIRRANAAEAERDALEMELERVRAACDKAIASLGLIKNLGDTNPTAALIARQALYELSLVV